MNEPAEIPDLATLYRNHVHDVARWAERLAGPGFDLPDIASEARSLAEALARWRRDGQAEAALALLGAHDRRFPQGALAIESQVARAEILLTLGRRDQALSVLDRLALTSLPRARELKTLRGTLRAQSGRCLEARLDLSAVMAITPADDLSNREARALATCP
jgi:hypothetical protein